MTLWEILKANKIGIAPDMFTMLAASKMNGGRDRLHELTGIPPLSFTAKGKPLTAWSITGNTVQNGTPTPENPVEVQAVGDKTGNVMPAGEKKTVVSNGITFDSDGSGRYHISGTASAHSSVSFNLVFGFTVPTSVSNGGQGTLSFFNTQLNNSVDFAFYNGTTKVDAWTMLSINRTSVAYIAMGNKYVDKVVIDIKSGATVDITIMPEFTNDGVLPTEFEPYGYKIPFTTAAEDGTESITTPIYLPTPLYSGEVMRSDGTIARSDGTTETFTASQIPTINGTTVIDVDTAVKPESMTIKYRR